MRPRHVLILEPACAGRVGPLGPFAAVVVSVMLSPATGCRASKAAHLPHPSSLLTWALNKAFSPVLLFVLWREAFQDLGAGQVPAGASWVGQTPELAGGCHTGDTLVPAGFLHQGLQVWHPIVSTFLALTTSAAAVHTPLLLPSPTFPTALTQVLGPSHLLPLLI